MNLRQNQNHNRILRLSSSSLLRERPRMREFRKTRDCGSRRRMRGEFGRYPREGRESAISENIEIGRIRSSHEAERRHLVARYQSRRTPNFILCGMIAAGTASGSTTTATRRTWGRNGGGATGRKVGDSEHMPPRSSTLRESSLP